MFTCRLNPIALLVIVLLVTGCTAQPSNETLTVQCEDPPPTASFTCNNISGLWEIENLIAESGEVIFASPAVIYGNLTLGSGATIIFRDYNSTYVYGKTSITSTLILDMGNSSDDGLFYEFTSLSLKSMPLIKSQEPFFISGTAFFIYYTGGCTKVSGSLDVSHHATAEYPYVLHVSHLKKSGTGNCHWVWSLLSFLSTMTVLIIVPLIEKYAWKVYD